MGIACKEALYLVDIEANIHRILIIYYLLINAFIHSTHHHKAQFQATLNSALNMVVWKKSWFGTRVQRVSR